MFSARYKLSPYITQIRFVFKRLNSLCLAARGVFATSNILPFQIVQ